MKSQRVYNRRKPTSASEMEFIDERKQQYKYSNQRWNTPPSIKYEYRDSNNLLSSQQEERDSCEHVAPLQNNSGPPSHNNFFRDIFLKLTCQEPFVEEDIVEERPEVSKPIILGPCLDNLHKELRQNMIAKLQTENWKKDQSINRYSKENSTLNATLKSINEDLVEVLKELEKAPRSRLHLELVQKVNRKLSDTITSRDIALEESKLNHIELQKELTEARIDSKRLELDKESLLKTIRRMGDRTKELRASNTLVMTLKREIENLKTSHLEQTMVSKKIHEDRVINLQAQLRATKEKLGLPYEEDNDELKILDRDELKALVDIKEESIVALRDQMHASESTRRKLHNVIQQLRGNIRVFVRVRPFLQHEVDSHLYRGQIVSPIAVLEPGNALSIDTGNFEKTTFEFDKVYGSSSTQEYVFEELSDFVQSALDGYNTCIFAYGQTGSGKTHTMQGEGFEEMRGITPRAVEQILKAGNRMKHSWNFYVQVNYVEIYNEKLVDLLKDIKEEVEFFNSCEDEMMTLNPGINQGSETLTLRKDVLGHTFVEGLTNVMIDINDYDKGMAMINSILKCAARARSVACTKMNDRSSRSHSVFTLDIAGKNIQSGAVTAGALHLVDLAGSERLDMENDIDPKQLRETTNINKSLSCLGDVFSALSSGSGHVPYRNSKLTYLLQDCLGGDGKACMVVNLNPTSASCNETMQSLRFAQRVSQIELGRGNKKVHLPKQKDKV